MKRLATLTVAVCLLAVPAFASFDGAWTATVDSKHPDRVYVSMTRGTSNQNGTTMPLSGFTGLTNSQLNADTATSAQFAIRREAGTIAFEGTFRKGNGAGQFTFTGNPQALDAMRASGVEPKLRKRERSEDETLYTMTLFDVSTAFVRTMIGEGYRASLDDYVAMRIFDITPEYIREMRSLGFNLTNDDLVASKIHGVTPQYVRQMRDAGWDAGFDELVSSRIHGATPQFAEEMKKLGYPGLSHKDLVAFRIHGVTAGFITTMREMGYDKLTASQLVAMRIHRVTPEFIKEVEAAGYSGVPVDKLISMRISGIDGEFLRRAR